MIVSRREAAGVLMAATQAGAAAPSVGIGRPIGPTQASYAQAFLVAGPARFLFIGGQVPARSDGGVPRGFGPQARLVWHNVEAQLRQADMTLNDLVKVTIYLSDRRYRGENTAVRMGVLRDHTPALTVIIAEIFDPEWLLEVEAIACA